MLPHDNGAKNTTIKITEEDHSEKLLQTCLSDNSVNILMVNRVCECSLRQELR